MATAMPSVWGAISSSTRSAIRCTPGDWKASSQP
jgi:hypothetical protein